MAYGEGLSRLNPLGPELMGEMLARFLPPQARVADVGCGRGDTLNWLRQHTRFQVVGVEADPDYAASCGALRGRAEALPLTDSSVDAALLGCVFSLVEQAEQAAGEIYRVLAQGGWLIISDLYARKSPVALADSSLLRHVYTREELEGFFLRAGLVCRGFWDHTFAMQTMLAQMIMDGGEELCCGAEGRARLKQAGAGYGLWLFVKEG